MNSLWCFYNELDWQKRPHEIIGNQRSRQTTRWGWKHIGNDIILREDKVDTTNDAQHIAILIDEHVNFKQRTKNYCVIVSHSFDSWYNWFTISMRETNCSSQTISENFEMFVVKIKQVKKINKIPEECNPLSFFQIVFQSTVCEGLIYNKWNEK